MYKFYKISHAAETLGVSQGVLRQWADEKSIHSIRTPGGQRLFDISSITGSQVEKSKPDRQTILYSRVSSSKQKDDLTRQQQFIKDTYPTDKHPGRILEIQDIGSGINFKRAGLLRVLGLVKTGSVSTLVVASKDRLARFGFELIEWLCSEYDCKIIILDNQDGAPEDELGKDLMAIVQVYCCRWNGKRRYKNKAGVKTGNNEAQVEPEQGTKGETV